jgi:beta-lactam-binding protein with PASTA domain
MHGSSVILISLVTSALTTTGATYLIQRYQVFSPEPVAHVTPAPMLVGLSEADARANTAVEGREPTPGAAAGTVVRQSIAPGQPVSEGAGIGVTFAASLPTVPQVSASTGLEATEKLTRGGYKVVLGDPVPHAKLPVGSVVSQFPEADSELAAGSAVTLHLSSGPALVEAPKLVGMDLPAAKDKLSELGLTLEVRWISRGETVENRVLSQKPNPGKKLAPKSVIEVVVNR